jgi:hypothetical protein
MLTNPLYDAPRKLVNVLTNLVDVYFSFTIWTLPKYRTPIGGKCYVRDQRHLAACQ